ncbi:type II CAAX endopeptidase family protein [Polyangium aurulentum]|uniref:type II CAAX endopeptidase family protein n=1 Tax=Polyangium aurulentum TaxID=2567896 RepID=UPI0010AE6F53|nr:type II CAAX endopeptidase family protein [Polyangium aurulentum]UQA58902.1 CPBP family intramembrane metalloprotease [Polyangium aurulentum]
MDPVQRARRGLAIFFAVLVPVSVLLEMNIVRHGALTPERFVPLLWTPCFASIVARIVMREGIADVSFRLDRRAARAILLGCIYPIAVAAPAYGIAWAFGMGHFEPASMHPLGFEVPGTTPGERLLVNALIAVTLGPLVMGIFALGEEIGWRGYMLTRLIDARVPQPVLVSGLVWGLWHGPLILSKLYNPSPHPPLALLLFVVTVTGSSFMAARLRLDTGSVWPPVIMHAAWNAILVSFFDASTHGATAPLWTGEGGVLVALSTAVITAVLLKFRRSSSQAPRAEAPALGTVRL